MAFLKGLPCPLFTRITQQLLSKRALALVAGGLGVSDGEDDAKQDEAGLFGKHSPCHE